MFTFTPGITMTAGMTFSPNTTPPPTLDYLLVAGGGGGGGGYSPAGNAPGGAGGGAGGYRTATGFSIASGTTYAVTVGTGGAGGAAGASGSGASGLNSVVSSSNSYSFNGSNYLSIASNTGFDFGSGDFTIEAWAFFTSFSAIYANTIVSKGTAGVAGADIYSLQATSGGIIQFFFGVGAALLSGSTLSTNTWYHLAVTRSGSTFTLWVNGVSSNTATSSPTLSAGGPLIIGSQYYSPGATDRSLYGYASNLRIVKGLAVYTGNFTVPTSPLTATQSAGTNISAITGTQTRLLTLQNITIVDNSSYGLSITNTGGVAFSSITPFIVTAAGGGGGGTGLSNGVAGGSGGGGTSGLGAGAAGNTPSTSPSQGNAGGNGGGNTGGGGGGGGGASAAGVAAAVNVGGGGGAGSASTIIPNYSVSFNGSSQYLTSSANLTNNFSTGNFTIECWVYFVSVANGQLVSAGTGTNTNAYYWQYYSGQLQFGVQNVGPITVTSWTPSASTWYHIAVVRSGTNVYQFVNGTQLGTTATSSQNFVDGPTYVGYGGAGYLNGYLSNLRIVKGTALYTSNFPVPTPPLRPITNTSLLTAQSSTIVDNSTNASTITSIGSPTVSSSVIPTAYYAGGGGGGGGGVSAGFGVGGVGGGGQGSSTTTGTAGATNTGGGGGGATENNIGGAGGSGIAVIRYSDGYALATTTGSPSLTITGGYNIYTWTSSGSFIFTFVTPTVEYLVVAGGGGGGANIGGGGGAGGLRTATGLSVSEGTAITVTVGAGGVAGVTSGAGFQGGTGVSSVFSTITSSGGGGGGYATSAGAINGTAGGSGGGAGSLIDTAVNDATGGTGIAGQGFRGGNVTNSARGAGGGGGASAAGGDTGSDVNGAGGAGSASSISGTSVTYAGGGGAGGYPSAAGAGGAGGGGAGGGPTNVAGTAGTVNTGGGGGGGGGGAAPGGPGAAGGSGIVIIRYASTYPLAASTTGSPSVAIAGGYNIYTWTSSGSITF